MSNATATQELSMGLANLARLSPWDAKSGALNVVIETSKGSRNKLKFDAALLFGLNRNSSDTTLRFNLEYELY